jgi:beta-glucanase (GH16 family)
MPRLLVCLLALALALGLAAPAQAPAAHPWTDCLPAKAEEVDQTRVYIDVPSFDDFPVRSVQPRYESRLTRPDGSQSVKSQFTSEISWSGLSPGTNYGFEIRAYTSSDEATGWCSAGTRTTAPNPPPTVQLVGPTEGQLVSGAIRVDATATDAWAVVYYVDGAKVAKDVTCCAWDESWDSTAFADGVHVIVARAIGPGGVTDSAPIMFTVENVADPPPDDAEVVFFDGFAGPAGSPPDPARWEVHGGASWGVECFTDRPENVALDGNGLLVLTARSEDSTPCSYDGSGAGYTSGGVSTGSDGVLFNTLFGRVEFRAKISCGNGTWDALWMSGVTPGFEWPTDGEIDVFEHMAPGSGPVLPEGRLRSTIHGPTEDGGRWQRGLERDEPYRLCDDFHTYAVDWKLGSITFLFDGEVLDTFTPSSMPAGGVWPFDHHAERLLVTLQLGDQAGPIDDDALPASLLVDWVRVTR